MAILKKVKASTIMETLVASILIVTIFVVSSMILNNMFANSIRNDTKSIKAHLNELEYQYINGKLTAPFQDEFKEWDFSIYKKMSNGKNMIFFMASNPSSERTIEKTCFAK